MGLGDLARAAAAVADAPTPPPVYTATVVRADESGLWVVPIGEDPRHPIGPCRGGWTANGTRVPPGALVILVETAEGPWAVGVDNPALAINDSTLAPFGNPSFELVNNPPGHISNTPCPNWSDFWSSPRRDLTGLLADTYTIEIEDGSAAHGLRAMRVDGRSTWGTVMSDQWSVAPGSSLEVSFYARSTGPNPLCNVTIYSSTPTGVPQPFGADAVAQTVVFALDGRTDWLRYRATYTLPPTHTKVRLFFDVGADDLPGATATVWLDNIDADLVEINPAAEHIDYIRRAVLTLLGGGTRTVTAGGNVSWSQSFTIAGAGMVASEALDGRFAIAQPANGTVIPVHSSAARTSHTVAGGVIALNADDALWYELPLGAAATSQPARFHIIGSSAADNYVVPPHWVMIVRRASAWSSTSFAPEYVWGDGRAHDPWRTPGFAAGWSAGTIPPRYRKEENGDVTMRGRVAGGASVAFTLPVGYTPPAAVEAIVRDGVGAVGMVTVAANGDVTPLSNVADHSIAIRFSTEP